MYEYPTDIEITYTNSTQFRASLRKLFRMSSNNFPEIVHADIDDESRDELEYDEKAAVQAMDSIFLIIENHPLFQAALDKAAGRMFSTNRGIGLSILFCYDYLDVFHKCLVAFLTDPGAFSETSTEYLDLLRRLA